MSLREGTHFFVPVLVFLVHCFVAKLAIAAVSGNIETDQSALLALKNHIIHDPSNILATNWSMRAPVCDWFGITCGSRPHRVTVLELPYMDLVGTIPPELGNLSFLSGLYLQNNSFQGSMPNELAQLGLLETMQLQFNNMEGDIPRWIGFLPRLENLILGFNSFTGTIPASIQNASFLQALDLSDNRLSGGLPPGILNIASLQEIYVSDNQLSGSIPSISNISALIMIEFTNNNLSGGLPEDMFDYLPELEFLHLSVNQISGDIPTSLFNCKQLQSLSLSFNNFTGSIPAELGNFTMLINLVLGANNFQGMNYHLITLGNLRDLQSLNLAENDFITESSTSELGIIKDLTNCKSFRYIDLSNNPLNAFLPNSLGNLSTSLGYFRIQSSGMKGSIPLDIGNFTELTLFSLSFNQLTGTIPASIGKLQSLQVLYISDNQLEGSIPNELCHLENLAALNLGNNKLSGSIPTCLVNLTSSLRSLLLYSNRLNSTIPSSFWGLSYILNLDLSSNSLEGSLPLDVKNLRVVTELYLEDNQLSGNVPRSIGDLQDLVTFSLARNAFSGPIPESTSSLISSEYLDFSENKLSGVIPKSLEALVNLKYFNLSFNKLQGEIPSEGAFRNFTAQSFIGNVGLCGDSRLSSPTMPNCRIWKRGTKRRAPEEEISLATWRRISYYELQQATNDFDETNLLGTGSFGRVYKGRLSDEMDVAVKVFNLQHEGAFQSFDAECEIFQHIRHRNLVKIISSCSNNDDFKALVLSYMPNGSLEKWLYSYNYCLNILERLNIMTDVAAALNYMHHENPTPIVHRDLKPSNVLLDEDKVAHVTDFGMAKLLGRGDSITQTITLATIGYMAPEYGLEGNVSRRGDVYSYGILLLETFTRKKPCDEIFQGELSLKTWVKESCPHSIIDVVDNNLLREEEENLDIKKDCLLSIIEVALECLADSPEERSDMKDVLVALNKIKMKLQNVAVSA
ncbi:putative Receptor-kinase [Quillaja saponaria]|uniref:non-specific serine/threonine protein kinase n=1 Tax=Quillaja saponaria TaxID=32244 RepID=A0AAD7KX01_QUISA|nr:putative Receptor-kinase [Quillaja saponaria]